MIHEQPSQQHQKQSIAAKHPHLQSGKRRASWHQQQPGFISGQIVLQKVHKIALLPSSYPKIYLSERQQQRVRRSAPFRSKEGSDTPTIRKQNICGLMHMTSEIPNRLKEALLLLPPVSLSSQL